jgi:hypothetical protein
LNLLKWSKPPVKLGSQDFLKTICFGVNKEEKKCLHKKCKKGMIICGIKLVTSKKKIESGIV